jgi:hypothetical protein
MSRRWTAKKEGREGCSIPFNTRVLLLLLCIKVVWKNVFTPFVARRTACKLNPTSGVPANVNPGCVVTSIGSPIDGARMSEL